MLIIFCDSVIDNKVVDSDYAEEKAWAEQAGHETALISYEALEEERMQKALRFIKPSDETQSALYRGWMMRPSMYKLFYEGLLSKNIKLINEPIQYQHCHYLPDSYSLIKDMTCETVWMPVTETPDWKKVHAQLGPFGTGPVIVKDYVKSEKHNWEEACFIPNAADKEAVESVVTRFLELRGSSLNEGLVFRRFEKLTYLTQHSQSAMPLTKEFRMFFFKNALMATFYYWEEGHYGDTYPETTAFEQIAKSINSNFFTMDIAQKEDGSWMVMELGDGQVAGIPTGGEMTLFRGMVG
ncbi:MAG: ATP-grasp domain-containing protein [Bacteroidia bacterium]